MTKRNGCFINVIFLTLLHVMVDDIRGLTKYSNIKLVIVIQTKERV